MLRKEHIMNNLGLPASYKGDRIDALNAGATHAYKLMDEERQTLLNRIEELQKAIDLAAVAGKPVDS